MKNITVTFNLTEEQEQRLIEITNKYHELGLMLTPEKQFENIMLTGSLHDINSKLDFQENLVGLN